MNIRVIKLILIPIFILLIFEGSCKSPFTSPETSPVIWVNTFSFSFSATEQGPNPSSQTLLVKNSGSGTLNYTIADDADTYDVDWLTITPSSGTSNGQINEHTVTINKAGMPGRNKDYKAKIIVSSPEAPNSPQTIDVSLKIAKEMPPKIAVSPNAFSFAGKQGSVSNPSSQTLKVKNDGEETLNYTISDDATWLDVNPKNGTAAQGEENSHTVIVDISGLAEGTYTGKITITDDNASNSPMTVTVTLNVTKQPPPEIQVSPTSLSFSAKEGGTNPSSQSISIKNSGQGTLNYTISDDGSWLEVNPSSGSSSGETRTHRVSVNISGLSEGSYQAEITVSDANASNNPQVVDVTLTVSKQPPPQIWVNTSRLSFSAKEGGTNPQAQSISIRNSGEGTLNYTISDDASWLNVSPQSGTSKGGTNSHSVSVNISGLSEGTYKGTITISDPDASNSPQTVEVTLSITKETPPQIWINTASLSFEATSGGSNPSSKILRIKNSGGGTLNYQISDDASWLDVSPQSGTSTGGENSHNVAVNISGLSPGTYQATITISDPNASNSPQTVNVTLTVNSPPTDNKISVACSPTSGGAGTIVTVTISIKGNVNEIKAFGLDLTYDSSMFSYQSFSNGSLTSSWSGVDANEISPGTVKVGGWGGTNSISPGSTGSLIQIKLKVTCSGCSSGTKANICIKNFTDDIVGMVTSPGCVTFTYE